MCLSIGALAALLAFLIDIIKWHSAEKKEDIRSSYETFYGKGVDHIGRTGDYGTGTGDNNNDTTGTGNNNNDLYNDNERSNGNIKFEL